MTWAHAHGAAHDRRERARVTIGAERSTLADAQRALQDTLRRLASATPKMSPGVIPLPVTPAVPTQAKVFTVSSIRRTSLAFLPLPFASPWPCSSP